MDKTEIAENTQPSIDELLAQMQEGKEDVKETEDKKDEKPEVAEEDEDKDGATEKEGSTEKSESDKEEEEKEEVSESVRAEAQKVFESAVDMKVSTIREQLEAEKEAEMQAFAEELESKIDSYCDHVVSEWMEENKLVAEAALRTEISENFMEGLKNLFLENHFEVPEEKADLCESLGTTVSVLKQDKLDLMAELEEAKLETLKVKKASIIESVGSDLYESQKVKLEQLAESITATDTQDFEEKLASIKNVFFSESVAPSKPVNLDESNVITEDYDKPDTSVSIYADFLGSKK